MAAFPGGNPTREPLDAIVADRPVYLPNRDGHGAWVNSKALQIAGGLVVLAGIWLARSGSR